METQNIFLEGEKVFLRAFEPGDEYVIAQLENHPDPRLTLLYALPTSPQKQLEKTLNQLNDPNTIIFTICDKMTGDAVGQTGFFRIDWVGRMAIFYIGISKKINQGKGFGKETVKLMIEYAFDILNMHRIQLHVTTENTAAIKAYERNGFLIEGLLREAMYGQGEYHDFHLMGILKKDYLKLKNQENEQ